VIAPLLLSNVSVINLWSSLSHRFPGAAIALCKFIFAERRWRDVILDVIRRLTRSTTSVDVGRFGTASVALKRNGLVCDVCGKKEVRNLLTCITIFAVGVAASFLLDPDCLHRSHGCFLGLFMRIVMSIGSIVAWFIRSPTF